MLYVTGDTHAIEEKWLKEIHTFLASGDVIIIAGDFGIGFWNGRYFSEELFFDWLAEQNYTILFVDGNHENFDKLNSYETEIWNGGRVHKIRHNVIHLMRGEIYNIEDCSLFTFGGGYSMDKYRRQQGVSWWPQEMPMEEEYQNAKSNLEKVSYSVDYVVTHTAAFESIYYLSTNGNYGIKKLVDEELPLTTFFDEIQSKLAYKRWYFGHLHVDAEIWRRQTAVFSTIYELKTGKAVKSWNSYEG